MTRFPFPPLRTVAFLSPVSGPSSECANISCCRWKAAQTSDLGADVPRAPSRPPMLWPRAYGPSSQGKPPGPLLESGDQRELGVPCSQEDRATEQWGCGGTEARGGLQATSLSSAWRYFRPQETLDVFGAGPCFHAGQIRMPSRRIQGPHQLPRAPRLFPRPAHLESASGPNGAPARIPGRNPEMCGARGGPSLYPHCPGQQRPPPPHHG